MSSTTPPSIMQLGFIVLIIIVTGVGLVANSGILYPMNSGINQKAAATNGTIVIEEPITNVSNITGSSSSINGTNKALIKPIQYELEIRFVGNGTVSTFPSQLIYDSGSAIQLTAHPDEGWIFERWSGAISNTTNPITITIAEDTKITAIFKEQDSPKYVLTVEKIGTGNGTVTLDPPGGIYTKGTLVTLIAKPNSDTLFDGWSNSNNISNVTKLTVTSNETIVATFTKKSYNLTININPAGSGSVSRDHDGPYQLNEKVTLIPTSNNEYIFAGWSGDEASSESALNLTISGNEVITANFEEQQHIDPPQQNTPPQQSTPNLPATSQNQINILIVGQGSVSKNPDKQSYSSSSSVQLLATPLTGWRFVSWNGDVSGNN